MIFLRRPPTVSGAPSKVPIRWRSLLPVCSAPSPISKEKGLHWRLYVNRITLSAAAWLHSPVSPETGTAIRPGCY